MAKSTFKKCLSCTARHERLFITTRIFLAFVLLISFSFPGFSQAFDLSQGENGGKPSSKPISALSVEDPVKWVNANLGGTNAHFMEGYSVPYRAVLTNLLPDTEYVIRIGFDVRDGGKYALDYLTGVRNLFNHQFFVANDPDHGTGNEGEAVNPLANPAVQGINASTLPSTFTIPDINYGSASENTILKNSFSALNTQDKRELTLYNGVITEAFYQAPAVDVTLKNFAHLEAILLVRFKTNNVQGLNKAVLAWGGHIASQTDWGLGESASAISGSPYHMRIVGFGLDNETHTNDNITNGGNTDRSLKTDAVIVCAVDGGTIAGDQTICSGDDPAAITSVAPYASANGTKSYKWIRSTTSCTAGFSIIANATDSTYDPGPLTDTTYYRRITSNATNGMTCEDTSNCVTILINDVDAGTISGNQTICSGTAPNQITVTGASGDGTLTYQWQSNTTGCNGTWTNLGSPTANAYYQPGALTDTTYYRAIVISTSGTSVCKDTTGCATVFINDVDAGTISGNQTICAGEDPTAITVTGASGDGTLTYQWQSNTTSCSGTWTNINGPVSSNSYDPGPLTDTTYYRAIVISTNGTSICKDTTGCITVIVNPIPGKPTTEYIAPQCYETQFKLRVKSPLAGVTYKLFKGDSTFVVDSVAPNTSDFVFKTGINAGDGYIVIAERNGCASGSDKCVAPAGFTRKAVTPEEQKVPVTQELKKDPVTELIAKDANILARIEGQTKVLAAPNPFTDKVRFTLQSGISGQGSLEIYNTIGQKLATVYQGYVEAGKPMVKEYMVPRAQRANLIYIFRVGDQKSTGKLLNR